MFKTPSPRELLAYLLAFGVFIGIWMTFMSYLSNDGKEWVGVLLVLVCGILLMFLLGIIQKVYAEIKGNKVELSGKSR